MTKAAALQRAKSGADRTGPSGRAILLWGGGAAALAALLALTGWFLIRPALRAREIVFQAATYGDFLPLINGDLLPLIDDDETGPAWGEGARFAGAVTRGAALHGADLRKWYGFTENP